MDSEHSQKLVYAGTDLVKSIHTEKKDEDKTVLSKIMRQLVNLGKNRGQSLT